ncbi:unnamed protein product [Lactuca virosa]|uniref:Factor of DNA methylation 1-5/IDN2 domain-containing protein n=1 Tax=Lactuca virosa TaxID=75947 RepID=A0AAU9LVB6_9ASTR|nr:unnamed protein product [Lactuca virosa]
MSLMQLFLALIYLNVTLVTPLCKSCLGLLSFSRLKLEMGIEELKGKLQVMKHLGDEDDAAFQEKIKLMNFELETKMEEMKSMDQTRLVKKKIKEMNIELETKMKEIDNMDNLNETLLVKDWQCSDELEEAHKELTKWMQDMLSGRTNIGVKRMGEINMKAFHGACKDTFDKEEAQIKTSESRSLWQNKVKSHPEWHVVEVDGDDEKVKSLKAERGNGIFDAFKEMNEYNPSGRYVVNKIWNLKDNHKAATLKEKKIFLLKMVVFGAILMAVVIVLLTKFPLLLTFPQVLL